MRTRFDRVVRDALWMLAFAAPAQAATPLPGSLVGTQVPAAGADEPASPVQGDDEEARLPGARGTISFGYQYQDTKGLLLDDGSVRGTTTTDTHVAFLDLDYRLSERWQAHVAIPFIRKRSSGGPGAHRLDILTVPHPEATFLDDGEYHGGLQDWVLGLSRHGAWGRFEIEPHVYATIPSHDYSHFGNAAIGQNLWKLKLGADLLRRPAHSNLYWSLGYSYEVWEKVLGITLNKHHARASVGYLLSPRWSVRAFANARGGLGRNTDDFPNEARNTEAFYQHDRTSQHTYVIAGAALGYQLTSAWAATATAAKMVHGRNIHDLRYAYSVQLSYGF